LPPNGAAASFVAGFATRRKALQIHAKWRARFSGTRIADIATPECVSTTRRPLAFQNSILCAEITALARCRAPMFEAAR
jgi:hypothetical protein